MRTWKRVIIVGLVVALLLFAAAVVAALALEPAAPAATELNWQVVASGGTTMNSASYMMMSTTGQPVTGEISGSSYSLLSGYWHGFQGFVRSVLLPFIVGNP